MHEQGEDSTTTKATLTEGKITLNKDSQPTETTAAALGINTDLSQANKQVEQPKDVNQLLKEQKTITEAVGHIATAATNFSHRQAKDLEEEAKEAEKAGDYQTAKAKREEAKSWETGGKNKRKVDAITTALSLALAGQSPKAIATGAASPYINQAIKNITEEIPELNIPAHILWGAIEAELTGGKAATGAIAAGVGELSAPILSQALYGNKKTNELTDAEKQQVLNLSKLVAGIASGLTATGNSAENIATISQGMKIAENAVENNYFDVILNNPQVDWYSLAASKHRESEIQDQIIAQFEKEHPELIKNLKATGDVASFLADFTPIIGDAKSFAEAKDAIDYVLATVGVIPGADLVTKSLKEAKNLLNNARKAEKLGDIKAAHKYVEEATRHINHNRGNLNTSLARTCSFRGDMEVKTDKGYQPISSIKVGDKVLAKNEITGITTYQKVHAHYSNPYDYTVYVEVKDSRGKFQTIVSNKIHPFFAQVLSGIAPASSEGHDYNGEIAKAQWIDAQYLQKGYRLLSANGEWQTVSNVNIKAETLKAYNMTVTTDHTYFIRGAKADNEGVWVHNDCWHALPKDAKRVENIDGYKTYQFTDPKDGKVVTVVQKDLNRFETPNHQNGVDPHFNRLSQQIDAETGRYLSTDNPVDGLYNRSYLRSETLQKIYSNYEKLPNGNYRDLDGNIIKGPIDIGHVYGWEHRRLSLAAKELNWSQKQFNDYVNARSENFRLENMSENRSHKNEMPGKHDIKSIIDDMKQFQKIGK